MPLPSLTLRYHLEFEARRFEDLGETAQFRVSSFGECSAKRHTIHPRFARHRCHSASRLRAVAERQHERRLITLGKGSVQIGDAKLRVTQLLGEPLTLIFRRPVSSAFHSPSSIYSHV